MTLTRFVAVMLVGGAVMIPDFDAYESDQSASAESGYDRPAPNRHQSRSVVIASNGIVATSQPLAAQVGLDILKM